MGKRFIVTGSADDDIFVVTLEQEVGDVLLKINDDSVFRFDADNGQVRRVAYCDPDTIGMQVNENGEVIVFDDGGEQVTDLPVEKPVKKPKSKGF
jgi:hypothetical protein